MSPDLGILQHTRGGEVREYPYPKGKYNLFEYADFFLFC